MLDAHTYFARMTSDASLVLVPRPSCWPHACGKTLLLVHCHTAQQANELIKAGAAAYPQQFRQTTLGDAGLTRTRVVIEVRLQQLPLSKLAWTTHAARRLCLGLDPFEAGGVLVTSSV